MYIWGNIQEKVKIYGLGPIMMQIHASIIFMLVRSLLSLDTTLIIADINYHYFSVNW